MTRPARRRRRGWKPGDVPGPSRRTPGRVAAV